MAVCKSRTFMAFPSTRSQQPSTGCHNSHYAPQPQQETQPDRPIGYGAFGVVWWVFSASNSFFYRIFSWQLYLHVIHRSVTDPRNGKRVALKKMPNVFQSLTSSKRAYRELKMLCFFKHNNVSRRFSMLLAYKANISLNAELLEWWILLFKEAPAGRVLSTYAVHKEISLSVDIKLIILSSCRFSQLWTLFIPAT